MKRSLLILTVLAVLFSLSSCSGKRKQAPENIDLPQIKERDTLIAATLYGSTSYFIFKGEEMGFDYEMCAHFAQKQGLQLKMITAENPAELVRLLKENRIDLIACRLTITNPLKQEIAFVNNEHINSQVLVQRSSTEGITSQVELIGKTVYVLPNTKFETRLRNLNNELGGGVNIVLLNDSVSADHAIEMVSQGKIDYTLADRDIALLNKTYYRNIDCKIPVSFNQRSAWAVRQSSPELQRKLNEWFEGKDYKKYYAALYSKYFVRAKYFDRDFVSTMKGQLSPYDTLFQRHAKRLGWDWQLLAAIAYQESRFDTAAVSWAGAQGLMQLMPRTAAHYGLSEEELTNPARSVEAAVDFLIYLKRNFRSIADRDEQIRFVVAAYNSGLSHITDAQALAEKYGKNRHIWQDVAEFLELKSNPEYYNDPAVKSGYFRAEQTLNYVEKVLRAYERYMRKMMPQKPV